MASFQVDVSTVAEAIQYTPNGRYLAIGVGRVIQLWAVETLARVAVLTEHRTSPISTVAASPNSRFIAAFGDLVTIWELIEI
jgi:WD40 repeat protein